MTLLWDKRAFFPDSLLEQDLSLDVLVVDVDSGYVAIEGIGPRPKIAAKRFARSLVNVARKRDLDEHLERIDCPMDFDRLEGAIHQKRCRLAKGIEPRHPRSYERRF